jgi:hypothetical protein
MLGILARTERHLSTKARNSHVHARGRPMYPTEDGGGSFAFHPFNYGPMPDPFGDLTGGGTGNGDWLFYATLTVASRPALTMARSANSIVISYSAAASDFVLESTGSLSAPAWSKVTMPPVVVSNQATVTVQASGTATFYRLRK